MIFFVYLFTLAKRPLFCNLKKRDFGNNEDTHSVDNENFCNLYNLSLMLMVFYYFCCCWTNVSNLKALPIGSEILSIGVLNIHTCTYSNK